MQQVQNFSRITIFNRNHEFINIVIPLFFLIGAVIELSFLSFTMDTSTKAILLGLAATFLLNSTHVGVTFSGWMTLPLVNQWIKSKMNFYFFLGGAVLCASVLIGLFTLSLKDVSLNGATKTSAFVFLGYDLLILWHSLGQTKGLSFLYNKKILYRSNLADDEVSSLKRLENLEKIVLSLLFFSLVFSKITIAVRLFDSLQISELVFKNSFFGLNCFLSSILVTVSLLYPGHKSNKAFFCIRYILYAFLPVSFVAGVALLAIHGIEYVFLNYHVVKSTESESAIYSSWFRLSVLFCIFVFFAACMLPTGFGHFVIKSSPHLLSLGIFCTALIMALTTIHVFFDKIYYKLSGSGAHSKELRSILVR